MLRHLIAKCLGIDPLFLRGLLDFLAVLIDPGQKMNLPALAPLETRDAIGENFLIGMTQMGFPIHIINGGGDIKFFGHADFLFSLKNFNI